MNARHRSSQPRLAPQIDAALQRLPGDIEVGELLTLGDSEIFRAIQQPDQDFQIAAIHIAADSTLDSGVLGQ